MNYMKRFQESNNLIPDGIVGKQTITAFANVYNITVSQATHILAQIQVESTNFTAGRENLNYSEKGLIKTFGKYFNKDTAVKYAHNPIMIGNRVYANRMGNGSEGTGEGYVYRGGGALQLTGKSNYHAYFASLGLNVWTPSMIENHPHYFGSAVWFCRTNNLMAYMKPNSVNSCIAVSKGVNLGNPFSRKTPNGLSERLAVYDKYCDAYVNG